MSSVSEQLDITGYSLSNFYDSFKTVLVERLQNSPSLRVRFLVVDPKTVYSEMRERLEGHVAGTFATRFEVLRRTFHSTPNVEIRLYAENITTMIFQIDKAMFVGPQFLSSPSKSTVTLEIEEGKDVWLFRTYQNEFDAMWNRSQRV
jgi:hypothetical protein